MNNRLITRGFNFSTGTLVRDAQRLLGALNDGTIGPPIVVHLSATFVADFTAQIALVAKLGTDQSTAIGAVSSLTAAQEKALNDFFRLAALARRTAKFVLAGQDTILRSEFQLGVHTPKTISAILERGGKLLTACQTYADQLATRGWSSANTDTLATALGALTEVDRTQETSKDGKLGVTARRTAAARLLYEQCVVVQGAARIVYVDSVDSADPARVEARARFLLDEFPPRKGATVKVGPVPSAPPAPVSANPALNKAA
jgi:hypothetical protein